MTLFFMPFGVECTLLCIMFSGKSVIIVAMNHMWVKNVTWIQIMTQTGMVNKINPFEIIWDCIGEFLVKNSSNQLPKFQEKNTDNSSTSKLLHLKELKMKLSIFSHLANEEIFNIFITIFSLFHQQKYSIILSQKMFQISNCLAATSRISSTFSKRNKNQSMTTCAQGSWFTELLMFLLAKTKKPFSPSRMNLDKNQNHKEETQMSHSKKMIRKTMKSMNDLIK